MVRRSRRTRALCAVGGTLLKAEPPPTLLPKASTPLLPSLRPRLQGPRGENSQAIGLRTERRIRVFFAQPSRQPRPPSAPPAPLTRARRTPHPPRRPPSPLVRDRRHAGHADERCRERDARPRPRAVSRSRHRVRAPDPAPSRPPRAVRATPERGAMATRSQAVRRRFEYRLDARFAFMGPSRSRVNGSGREDLAHLPYAKLGANTRRADASRRIGRRASGPPRYFPNRDSVW